ncbi:hypothetical protein SAV31267_016680 [Streptomyces avermitilis]|uniref:Uncharacterized protein n=1 Tax=Streptomyces avermitilis TaxID=33903 RepID=A0A4D4MJB3_STRAX|nr:hypothetical protein SAV31267_016680 [Streptomyces avermitilis]
MLAVDIETCATALYAWDARLDAAQPVIRNRSRFVTELRALMGRSDEAQREAQAADAARERLEEQADHARSGAEQRRQETVHEGEAYAAAARAWTEQLRSLTGVPVDTAVSALAGHDPADGPLSAHAPDEVADAARSAVDPWLAELGEERDTLTLAARELQTERDRLRHRREEWERRTDPEPPPRPTARLLAHPARERPCTGWWISPMTWSRTRGQGWKRHWRRAACSTPGCAPTARSWTRPRGTPSWSRQHPCRGRRSPGSCGRSTRRTAE